MNHKDIVKKINREKRHQVVMMVNSIISKVEFYNYLYETSENWRIKNFAVKQAKMYLSNLPK